jgi:dTDP-4-dehydrorhamnose reductase
MKNALIIGGDSQIGGALARSFANQHIPGIATSRRESFGHLQLNLATSPENWPEIPQADVAYFCAAITKLDICEEDPETTRIINVTHMQALTEQLQERGTFVVFLSSNHVFDGRKPYPKASDPTSPVNEYGRQKVAFEEWLLSRKQPAAVLRLTKVVSEQLAIISQWSAALRKNETIEAFTDLRFAPVPLAAVLSAMQEIGTGRRSGISQLSGQRDISYYDIARCVAVRCGASEELVKPVPAASKNIPSIFLPEHGTLALSSFANITIPEPEAVLEVHDRRQSPRE